MKKITLILVLLIFISGCAPEEVKKTDIQPLIVEDITGLLIKGPYFASVGDEIIFTTKNAEGIPIAEISVEAFGETGTSDKNGQVKLSPTKAGAYLVHA